MKNVNVVGTPNATEDVYHHRKPGKQRAPLLRYFRFNLPRLTRAVMLALVAAIGVCAIYTAQIANTLFASAAIPLWIIGVAALVCVVSGCSRLKVWDFGALIAVCALVMYFGTILAATAPFVWNGATVWHAAAWNIMMLAAIGYLVALWAKWYGIIVAWPDDQNFTD